MYNTRILKLIITVYLLSIAIFHFSLSDRPRCVPGQRMRHEAHKFRSVAVECSVTANPDTELSFHWSFNDTVPKYAQKVTVPISTFC